MFAYLKMISVQCVPEVSGLLAMSLQNFGRQWPIYGICGICGICEICGICGICEICGICGIYAAESH